jgi:transcriptional regulator with XRE-family HTH domain
MTTMHDEEVFFTGAGEVIRQYRIGHDLTLEELAKKIKKDKSTLHRYETNESPLSDRVVKDVARALKMDPLVLMRECLMHLRPKLRYSPFGALLEEMLSDEPTANPMV